MTIPFLDYFKKKASKVPSAVPMPPAVPHDKPSADRMSKTVVPNATRTVSVQEAGNPFNAPNAGIPGARPMVTFGAGNRSKLPPAVALALEPRVERTISLPLKDVVEHLPTGSVAPLEEADAERSVLLKASELERGIGRGRPSVSIQTIFQQIPEVFANPIQPDDVTEVVLPLAKVMEQFNKFQVRADQSKELAIPQIETPFLQLTLEDDARFGTVTQVVHEHAEETAPVRVEPATAHSLAAAEPEATAAEKYVVTPVSFPISPAVGGNGQNGNGPRPGSSPDNPSLTRIAFPNSPKGTDESAVVPTSSGPSVPTSGSAPASAPTRIAFESTAPSDDARPKTDSWLTKENFECEADPAEASAPVAVGSAAPTLTPEPSPSVEISLALKPILQSLLPQQLAREIDDVPDDARMTIPFLMLEKQLASGRVVLSPDDFAHHLPKEYADVFDSSRLEASIVLPLQEVLKNLPDSSLRVRDDQEVQEIKEEFETPFLAKAAEDAKRFEEAAVAKAKAAALPPASVEVKTGDAAPANPAEADEELDAKTAVAKVGKMAGVTGCAVVFADGLTLAGNLPAKYEADGLCAMAPSFLSRIEGYMSETKLGELHSMTLDCTKSAMTFLIRDNLCLVAAHKKEALCPEIREALAQVLLELTRKYSNPA